MKSYRKELWFEAPQRRQLINITPEVEQALAESGVTEDLALINAMHITRLLNERGYRTRDGHEFSDTTVDRLIRDSTAKGEHRANFTRRVAGNKPWALKPEHEWVINGVEPIIAPELWQQCNDLLDARKTRNKRPANLRRDVDQLPPLWRFEPEFLAIGFHRICGWRSRTAGGPQAFGMAGTMPP